MVAVLPGACPSLAASPAADELIALAKSGGKPVIADFGLGFCMQCRKQAVILKEIREAYGDKVILRMVNVSKERALTSRYEVELIPTLVFFDAKCKKLAENTEEAAQRLGIAYRMENVTEITKIIAFGVMSTPALAVDGAVKVSGKIPTSEEIERILASA